MPTFSEIVNSKMYANDAFSKWLGIEIIELIEGECKLKMVVRDEMLNGFYIAHGGITYSFADSAFAFATNSLGFHAVSIETSISHIKKVVSGDTLFATTSRIHKSRKFASYLISVTNQDEVLVASFKGTVYYTGQEWE